MKKEMGRTRLNETHILCSKNILKIRFHVVIDFFFSSLPFWDPSNQANGMAISRMDSLLKLASEECDKSGKKINWVRISSNLFGTIMIHRVINEQVRLSNGQGNLN